MLTTATNGGKVWKMEVRPSPGECLFDMAMVKGKGGYLIGAGGTILALEPKE